MRNKEQEFVWQKVIEACMENVKHHFDDIQHYFHCADQYAVVPYLMFGIPFLEHCSAC